MHDMITPEGDVFMVTRPLKFWEITNNVVAVDDS